MNRRGGKNEGSQATPFLSIDCEMEVVFGGQRAKGKWQRRGKGTGPLGAMLAAAATKSIPSEVLIDRNRREGERGKRRRFSGRN